MNAPYFCQVLHWLQKGYLADQNKVKEISKERKKWSKLVRALQTFSRMSSVQMRGGGGVQQGILENFVQNFIFKVESM